MSKNRCKLYSLLFSVLFLYSCASIIHGPTQNVDISSQPTGANIFIDGRRIGQTPMSLPMRRKGRIVGEPSDKKEYNVSIEMQGFYPYEIKLKREVDGWFWGNIFFGGIIGIIVDASNGAMYKLTPNQIVATMGRSTASNMKGNSENIYIAATLQIDPSWQKIGGLKIIEP